MHLARQTGGMELMWPVWLGGARGRRQHEAEAGRRSRMADGKEQRRDSEAQKTKGDGTKTTKMEASAKKKKNGSCDRRLTPRPSNCLNGAARSAGCSFLQVRCCFCVYWAALSPLRLSEYAPRDASNVPKPFLPFCQIRGRTAFPARKARRQSSPPATGAPI